MTEENEALVLQIQTVHAASQDTRALMQQLYDKNRSLLHSFVQRYATLENIDDLLQEAYIPLYQAALTYKPDTDVSFITYAVSCVKNHLVKYLEDSGLIHIPQGMRMKYISL